MATSGYVLKSSHIKEMFFDVSYVSFRKRKKIAVVENWNILDIPAHNMWIAFFGSQLFNSFMTDALILSRPLICFANHDWGLRHERVKPLQLVSHLQLLNWFSVCNYLLTLNSWFIKTCKAWGWRRIFNDLILVAS